MPTIKKTVGQITLKVLTDVESTTYYYLLQSSMAPAPSAPTTNPPGSGWSTTEPEFFSYIPTQDTIVVSGKDYYTRSGSAGSYTYTIVSNPTGNPSTNSYYEKIYGDTRSLYVTIQTLYTDGTYDYTTPSLSSSYEAAKEAYNRAQSALTIAGDINQYFWSLTSQYSTSVPAGVYVTSIPQNQFKPSPAQGNILMQSTGLTIRNGAVELASLTGSALNFYKPGAGSQAPSIQLSNSALTIYNPNSNARTLMLDSSGLNFYGSNTSTADVTLNSDGLTLLNGSIKSGPLITPEQDGFLYLSPQVYTGIISGHSAGQIPIDNYVKNNWRQIIGRKFAVDTDGNLYANNANIEGAITATSLTIGSGSDAYDGAAAINISGYDIEIEKNGIDEVEGVSVYLYPILYHNGVQVPTIEVDYSHFIWYQDDDTIGTEGDGENSGRYLATYGHNYRVIYDFDDGAVGGGTEVVDRTIDPSKYITKISDTGITIHPEVYNGSLDEEKSSRIQLDGTGMNLLDKNGNSIAQYGSTARVGLNNSSRFLMNSNSLEAYDSNNNKYFEVNSNSLSWGNNTAATTDDLIDAAKTATNYITTIDNGGIKVHDEEDEDNYAKIDSNGLSVYKHETDIAVFGENTRIGKLNNASKVVLSPDSIGMYDANNINVFSSEIPEVAEEGSSEVTVELEGVIFESTSPHPAHQTSLSTGYYSGYDISELNDVATNENFTLVVWIWVSFGKPIDSPLWDVGFDAQVPISLEFTKGVSKTYTNIVSRLDRNGYQPGSSTLTINNISYNAITGIINCEKYAVFNDTDLVAYSRIEITSISYVHHNIKYPLITIKGDCCLNGDAIGNSSILGECFINPNTKLSSLIQTLGWDYGEDSVVISVSLFNSSYSVGSNEPAYVSAHIEPYDSTNPVIWTSSNEDVFTVRKKGYVGSGGSLIYNYITAVGNVGDVATLTCWINCGGALVKDSATVTITETTPQLPDE